MSWLHQIAFRLRAALGKGHSDRTLDEELQTHLALLVEQNVERGMSREAARRAANLSLGGRDQIKESVRDHRGLPPLERLWRDVRYGLRGISRSPLLSLAVVLALVAGIGLNAAAFAVVDGVWFHAPVERDPGSFVKAIPTYSGWFDTEKQFHGFTVKDYEAIRTRANSLREVAAYSRAGAQLDNDSSGAQVWLVTCNFFDVWSSKSRIKGRPFLPEECATPGSAPVALMNEGFWKKQYGGDPHIIGKIIRLDQRPYTVIGVTDARPPMGMNGDLWVPYTMQPELWGGYDGFKQHPDYPWLDVVGRLKPGHSQADAQAEVRLIEEQQDRLFAGRRTTVVVTNGSLFQNPADRLLGFIVLPLVMGPMVLILLVACTNVTVLLLSRAAARKSEIAIRLALGADRGRLLRMLATEGLIVAVVAGGFSVYLANKLPGVFWRFVLPQSGYKPLALDWIAFSFLAAITLLAGCIAGLAPARESLKVDLLASLKGQEGTATARSRGHSFLVIAQMAMSFVLVAGGVLFARVLNSITSADPGFETRQVFAVQLTASEPQYTPQSAAAFYRTVRERVRELPGVRSASYTDVIPFFEAPEEEVRVPGEAKGQGQRIEVEQVSTDFFTTLGISIVRGRAFQDSDVTVSSTPTAAIVSQAFAEDFWRGQNPLGKVLLLPDNTRLLVVGVARNVASDEFDIPDGPRLYLPQSPQAFTGSLLVRFDGPAGSLAPVIGRTIRDLDAAQSPYPVTLRAMVDFKAEQIRPITEVILLMAFLALLLAVSGVYGTVSFSMAQRTREFGIRMALGATRGRILRSVLVAGARQIAIGLFAGVLLAFPAAFAFWHFLRSPSVFGWTTYAISALLLTVAALSAYFIPARSAMNVDPMVALRYE
jgi:predicted permease